MVDISTQMTSETPQAPQGIQDKIQDFEQEIASDVALEQPPALSRQALARGITLALIGGSLWGLNGTLSKVLMDAYAVEPLWLACVRELTACWLFLGAAALKNPKTLPALVRDRRSLLSLAGIAIGSILFSQVAYLEAIQWTNSATATILQSLSVILVMVFVCATQKRIPRMREVIGLVLALVGTFLVATGGNVGSLSLPWQGLAWGLGCAVAAAILAIQPLRMIDKWGNFAVNGVAFLISGVVLFVVYQPWNHMPVLDVFGWFLVVLSVVLGTFGAYALYLQGVKEVGSIKGSMLGTSEPVMAWLSSVVWLGAAFSGADLVGFALILIMVFLMA